MNSILQDELYSLHYVLANPRDIASNKITLTMGYRSGSNHVKPVSTVIISSKRDSDPVRKLDWRNLPSTPAIQRSILRSCSSCQIASTYDDDRKFALHVESKCRGGCSRFTAVREAAAAANGRTSAETRLREVYRGTQRVFTLGDLFRETGCFLRYSKLSKNYETVRCVLCIMQMIIYYESFFCYIAFK